MTTRLSVGDMAHDFTLPTANGGTVTLSDLRGSRIIVYFYPAAMTPGCTTEACDFRDSLSSLAGAGYSVIGVSPDAVEKLAAFAEQEGLTFPLASDVSKTTLIAWGAFGEKTKDGQMVMGVIRSIVVIGAGGRVELAHYDVTPVGAVAALRADLGIV